MTYGSQEDGTGYLELTAEDNERLKEGKPVVIRSGDAFGLFTIQVQLIRPNKRSNRFPSHLYGPNYKPPEKKQ